MPEHFIQTLVADFAGKLDLLHFQQPVAYVYNPLSYAGHCYTHYWKRYGYPGKQIMLLGMNPGPWGMAQTGIPFGDPVIVRSWLGIEMRVGRPERMHPKRIVQGFSCTRSEVSGKRLWGWARKRFGTPDRFFNRFWVDNYCPLVFMEAGGRNRTPDKLPKNEKSQLLSLCDQALRRIVREIKPRYLVGVGLFAAQQASRALKGIDVSIHRITHPSPANPKANKGWQELIEREMAEIGIAI